MQATWNMTKEHAEELGNALLDAAADINDVCQIVNVDGRMASVPVENGQYLVGTGSIFVHKDEYNPIRQHSDDSDNCDCDDCTDSQTDNVISFYGS